MSVDPHNLSSQSAPQVDPPQLGGIRFGPSLTGALYLLLVGSAALALWAESSPAGLPRSLGAVAPWAFLTFAAAFAIYRLVLVKARRYRASKAFFQIGAMV